ncbi:MAG: hypothetical protein M1836_002226 [Candelina mexicana]|nr:MAG: hypothetical protein M1836_002226 [Candelina mexicana]
MPSPSPPPPLKIPPSTSTVSVRIIDSTARIKLPTSLFVSPHIYGHDNILAPSYAFLVEHPSGRKLLFDNGVRKDWQNYSPKIRKLIEESGWEVCVEKNVVDILRDNGIQPESIEGIVWSHYHWDHIGSPHLFPPSTSLIVGPGFKATYLPGYPSSPTSPILESDYTGRHIAEISFTTSTPIGGLRAHDYFSDGSFYLLEAGGHAVGHIGGLARVTSAPPSTRMPGGEGDGERGHGAREQKDGFIFMAADTAHHPAEFRPTAYTPLPPQISPSPLTPTRPSSTLVTSVFKSIHRLPSHYATTPFYTLRIRADGSSVAHDPSLAKETLKKVEVFDAQDNIFVVMAHDASLLDVIDFFPRHADGWGWKVRGRWGFLRDFEDAVEGVGDGEEEV